jgi:hypothetical protein
MMINNFTTKSLSEHKSYFYFSTFYIKDPISYIFTHRPLPLLKGLNSHNKAHTLNTKGLKHMKIFRYTLNIYAIISKV